MKPGKGTGETSWNSRHMLSNLSLTMTSSPSIEEAKSSQDADADMVLKILSSV